MSTDLDGLRVKKMRASRGWTQEDLAKRANLTSRTIIDVEKGVRISNRTAKKIANAFDDETLTYGMEFKDFNDMLNNAANNILNAISVFYILYEITGENMRDAGGVRHESPIYDELIEFSKKIYGPFNRPMVSKEHADALKELFP